MKLTIDRKASRHVDPAPAVIGRIEAVVIDERRQPVELVPGARALVASPGTFELNADLPLIPGSHLLVQVGDRHAPGAENKRFEVEVVGCKKWMTGHQIRTRLVEGNVPGELLRAA